MVDTQRRAVIDHRRAEAGEIATRILHDAPVPLDSPGIVLDDVSPPPATASPAI